jgi:exosortase/archaeosortase family protein
LSGRHQISRRAAVKRKLKSAFRRLRALDAASLWLFLACFLVAQTLLLSLLAEDPNQFVSLALAWYGAYLCCKRPLPMASRDMRPTLLGASLGCLLLLGVQWRVHLIAGDDLSIYLLPLLSWLGLLLLAFPARAMRPMLPSVVILALLPGLQILSLSSQFVKILIQLTANVLRVSFYLLGFPVRGDGAVLTLYRGGVEVWYGCSGVESLQQLLLISIVFAIAFPMLRLWQNLLMCGAAIWLALVINIVRIGMLLCIQASSLANRQFWFELFHTGWPSLLFPGFAAYLFVCLYVFWMEHQVAQVEES